MKSITLQIAYILDHECRGCERVKGARDQYPVCQPCPTYKRLNELGNLLEGGTGEVVKRKRQNRDHGLTYDLYLQEQSTGLSDVKIANKYNIARSSLARMKREWLNGA